MANLPPRHTARGIVLHNHQLLLMERWRSGLHYFSIPGGGIEAGETPSQTVVREIAEETNLTVRTLCEVIQMLDGDIVHHLFLCEYISGEPMLPDDAPEALMHSEDNKFQPGWFAADSVAHLPFIYWEPVRQPLILGLKNGFSEQITVVSAAPAA